MRNLQAATLRSPSLTDGYGVTLPLSLLVSLSLGYTGNDLFLLSYNKTHPRELKLALLAFILIQLYGYLHTQPTWGTHSDYLQVYLLS